MNLKLTDPDYSLGGFIKQIAPLKLLHFGLNNQVLAVVKAALALPRFPVPSANLKSSFVSKETQSIQPN